MPVNVRTAIRRKDSLAIFWKCNDFSVPVTLCLKSVQGVSRYNIEDAYFLIPCNGKDHIVGGHESYLRIRGYVAALFRRRCKRNNPPFQMLQLHWKLQRWAWFRLRKNSHLRHFFLLSKYLLDLFWMENARVSCQDYPQQLATTVIGNGNKGCYYGEDCVEEFLAMCCSGAIRYDWLSEQYSLRCFSSCHLFFSMSLRFSIFKHGLESVLSSVDQVYDHWWLWVRSLTESAFLHPPKLASIPSRFRAMVSPFSIRYAICNAVQPYLSLDFRISAPKACINFFTISSDGSNNTKTRVSCYHDFPSSSTVQPSFFYASVQQDLSLLPSECLLSDVSNFRPENQVELLVVWKSAVSLITICNG